MCRPRHRPSAKRASAPKTSAPTRQEKEAAKPPVAAPRSYDAPPPVRRRGAADETPLPAQAKETHHDAGPVVQEPPPHETPLDDAPHAPRGRWVRWGVGLLCIVSCLALVGGVYALIDAFKNQEEKLAKKADEDYDTGVYRSASQLYGQLATKFPDSENIERYKFRKELADIRHRISEKPDSPADLLDHLEQFMKDFKGNALLIDHRADLSDALIKLLVDYCESAEPAGNPDSLKVLTRAAAVTAQAKAIKQPKSAKSPDWPRSILPLAACVRPWRDGSRKNASSTISRP